MNTSMYWVTINPGDLRRERRGQGRRRIGQKKQNTGDQQTEPSSRDLPKAFLPQKFYLATLIALALGLEGGGHRAACICAAKGQGWGGEATGSAPQARLLPRMCFWKAD